jgi:hypothetical protein
LKDCDRIYQGDTSEAEAFLKQCLKHKDDLQTALNVLVTKKSSPIGLANRILGKVGLALEKVTRSNKDTRWKLSTNLINDPDRTNVLKAFELRWQLYRQEEAERAEWQKQAQTQVQQALQVGGQSPDYIYTNQSSPPNIEEKSLGVIEPLDGSDPVQELAQALAFCELPDDFSAVVEGYESSQVEDAFLGQDDPSHRQRLRSWWNESMQVREPQEIVIGSTVRVKETLLGDRVSLMIGVRAIVKAISSLGRLTLQSLDGRLEFFDRDEVEVLVSG